MLGGAALAQCAGAGFGTSVAIGGQAADIALDETRGVLYIANFTANRIEVMSTADNTIRTSMNLEHPLPAALALSPPSWPYLVVAHYPSPSDTSGTGWLTVINLNDNTRTSTAVSSPLGVSFTNDGRVLVVTTTGFDLFDPVSGSLQFVDSFANVSTSLAVAFNTFPAQILSTQLTASQDRTQIWGLANTTGSQMLYRYDVALGHVAMAKVIQATPVLLPRVSVSADGLYGVAGYAAFDRLGNVVAQLPDPVATVNIGGSALDSASNTLYAHFPDASSTSSSSSGSSVSPPSGPAGPLPTAGTPVLTIMDADNLTVRERLRLPENMTGRAVLTAAADILYTVSDSGVMVLPVGARNQYHRVAATQEDVVVRASFCDRRVVTMDLNVTDPGGGNTDFTVVVSSPGVTISPSSGMTPATVKVRVDPSSFQNQNGSVVIPLTIKSATAVNLPPPVRLVVNNRNPDQRGTPVNVPGRLTDILADPIRDRFYVVRQDKNQVLVYDGTTYNLIQTLRTATTPTKLAITFDGKYLLIGHDNSQLAFVYDLDSYEQQIPVYFPFGHYPRTLAASGNKLLAVGRGDPDASMTGGTSAVIGPAGGVKTGIDTVDFAAHRASVLPSLGVFLNQGQIVPSTVLTPSPNGNQVLGAMPDGTVFLYNASADTFTAARKDLSQLAGAYAASSYDQFVVGNTLFNSSLVPVATLDASMGTPSGFAFSGATGLRTAAVAPSSPGLIQRVDTVQATGVKTTRMVEAPVTGGQGWVFTRTLAPLSNRNAIVALTTSGFTMLAWNYDAAVAPPRIDSVVNAADQTQPVAPGALITVTGAQMSPVNIATKEIPLPTALGDSCLTVNGVPVPMIFVSSTQINAQLPFNVDGNGTMLLRTPGGTSDNYYLTIYPAAPRIFRTGTAGPESGLPAIYRSTNNELVTLSNPIHPKDTITIYATGLGVTSPAVDSGMPAPADPLPAAVIQPVVTLGGVSLNVDSAGLVAGEIGVYQINATVPGTVPLGMDVPLKVDQAGVPTTLSVRVVK